jgi:hypothetical protein
MRSGLCLCGCHRLVIVTPLFAWLCTRVCPQQQLQPNTAAALRAAVPALESDDLEAMMRAPMRSFEPSQMQVRGHGLVMGPRAYDGGCGLWVVGFGLWGVSTSGLRASHTLTKARSLKSYPTCQVHRGLPMTKHNSWRYTGSSSSSESMLGYALVRWCIVHCVSDTFWLLSTRSGGTILRHCCTCCHTSPPGTSIYRLYDDQNS